MDNEMKQINKLFTLSIFAFLLLAGCSRRTTPPGPDTIGGTVGGTSYTMLVWDEGLRILIWSDIAAASTSAGGGSTEDDVYRQEGRAEAPDGRSYDYYLETSNGVTADFSIDGVPYDLQQGALFLMVTRGGETSVQQLDRDLAALPATNEGIANFGQADPAIATFIQDAGGR